MLMQRLLFVNKSRLAYSLFILQSLYSSAKCVLGKVRMNRLQEVNQKLKRKTSSKLVDNCPEFRKILPNIVI